MDFTISLTNVGKISQIASYQKHPEGQQQPLVKGQILQGLISSKTTDGKFVLDLGGKQFVASTKIPLQPGQRLDVQVITTTPQIILKTLGDPLTQNIGKSIYLLDQQNSFQPLLQSLGQEVKQSPLLSQISKNILNLFNQILGQEPQNTVNQEQIRIILQQTGMDFEQLLAAGDQKKAVATLKSTLFEIIHKFSGNEKIQKQAEQLIKTIELYQNLNIRMLNDSLFFFPLPFPFLEQGYLLVSQDNDEQLKTNDENQGKKYSLHLKLEGLGNLQIDMYQKNDTVSLQFFAQDPERAAFLKEFGKELQEWLTALQLTSVSFLTGAEDPIKYLLINITRNQSGVLDTRA